MPDQGILDQRANKVFAALQECGDGWHSRAYVAEKLGKKALTDADVLALDYLVKQGLIEAEQHAIDSPIQQRWEYRITGAK